MDMTGERRIAASRREVWAALNDVSVLKQCIPGCETLEKESDTDMVARAKLQIGPVKATFNGKVKLSDLAYNTRLSRTIVRPQALGRDTARYAKYLLSHSFLTGQITEEEYRAAMPEVEG